MVFEISNVAFLKSSGSELSSRDCRQRIEGSGQSCDSWCVVITHGTSNLPKGIHSKVRFVCHGVHRIVRFMRTRYTVNAVSLVPDFFFRSSLHNLMCSIERGRRWGLEVCCATRNYPCRPISTYLERWKAPTSVVVRHGVTIYVSGLPPFDPDSGEIVDAPIERQTELMLEQLKLCVETAGSSLANVEVQCLLLSIGTCLTQS